MLVVSFNPFWLNGIISPYSSWKVLIIRIMFLGYSLVLSLLLVFIFSFKKNWENTLFSKLGNNTLFFYLIHPYILYLAVILWSYNDKSINIFDALLITVIVTVILHYLSKIKLLNKIIK